MKTVRFAAVSDTHCSLIDQLAWSRGLEVIRQHNPHFVLHLGDLFEASSASVHPQDDRADILDEYRCAAKVLDEMADAAPKAKRIWILGNHDDNIQRKDPRRVPKEFRNAVHWSEQQSVAKSFNRWQQVPYLKDATGCLRIGQVIFSHGFSLNSELEALQLNNYCGGFAHRLVVTGHTHAPSAPQPCMRTRKVSLPLWWANTGTFADIGELSYMDRNDKWAWGAAVVIGECDPSGECLPGRRWEAETRIIHMHSEWSPIWRNRRERVPQGSVS
jgi:predicted phosphodiesterase